MLGMLGGLLGLIPGLGTIVQGVAGAYFDQKVRIYQAKTGATRDVAVAAIQAAEAVQTRWWFVAALIPAWALPFVIYDWKAVVWDNIVMGGEASTPALVGTLNWVHITIVASIFAHGIMDSFRRGT